MIIKLLLPIIVLYTATSAALARPGNHEVREAVREAQQYQKNGRDFEQRGRINESHSGDSASSLDSAKKAGRMSAEERRALRQQINEAGQDLYSRRR